MKKLLSCLLALLMLTALTACGAKPENEITQLLTDGYEETMYNVNEERYAALYEKDDTVLKVTAPMTAALYADYVAIDFENEKALLAFIGGLTDVMVVDITDTIPTDEALTAQYAGRPMSDLRDESYEHTGNYDNEDGALVLTFDGPEYSLDVTVNAAISFDDLDDYSENALMALTIKEVQYNGFSSYYLDNE